MAPTAEAQQPTWFNAGPSAPDAANGGSGMHQPTPLPPIVTPGQANLPVSQASYATAESTASTFDSGLFETQAPLEQQLRRWPSGSMPWNIRR